MPVKKLLFATACGALAGLGGITMASQLKDGSPTYVQMHERIAQPAAAPEVNRNRSANLES
jgi:hypothetical protein